MVSCSELGATVPTPGLAVLESQLDSLDGVLRPWAALVAPALNTLTSSLSAPALAR